MCRVRFSALALSCESMTRNRSVRCTTGEEEVTQLQQQHGALTIHQDRLIVSTAPLAIPSPTQLHLRERPGADRALSSGATAHIRSMPCNLLHHDSRHTSPGATASSSLKNLVSTGQAVSTCGSPGASRFTGWSCLANTHQVKYMNTQSK